MAEARLDPISTMGSAFAWTSLLREFQHRSDPIVSSHDLFRMRSTGMSISLEDRIPRNQRSKTGEGWFGAASRDEVASTASTGIDQESRTVDLYFSPRTLILMLLLLLLPLHFLVDTLDSVCRNHMNFASWTLITDLSYQAQGSPGSIVSDSAGNQHPRLGKAV